MSDRPETSELAANAVEVLERLVAFDTTSRNSNLDLISYVERKLETLGVASTRVTSADDSKANLYATLGPTESGGVILSGHTDVVPVDQQDWSSDPFKLERRDGRLYGRGTSDMKGFLALALAAAPMFSQQGRLRRPVHLAFSYDEEVGCLGAPAMIEEIAQKLPPPAAVIVGEPSDMEVVSAQKGISVWKVTVTGQEAHSSQTDLGLSANMQAVRLMSMLTRLAEDLERQADPGSLFHPPHATLTIGQIAGGTAANILARKCEFVFDLRHLPQQDPDSLVEPVMDAIERIDREMKERFPGAGISVERVTATPPLAARKGNPAEDLAATLSGDDGPTRAVSYAAEAGQFQKAGFPTVICGPGSIEQAHRADEFIEEEQIERGASFMLRLADALGS